MYPGLSHDEIIEECLKELKHHFEVGPEVALISAEKGVQCVPFDESLQKKFSLTAYLTEHTIGLYRIC